MREFVFETLARRAADHPEREALGSGAERFSYGEFERLSNQLARHLVTAGVKRGDRVAISMTKSATYVWCLYGIMKAGGCYVPIDAEYPKGRMADIIEDCDISVAICSPEVLAVLCKDGPPPKGLRHVVLHGTGTAPSGLKLVSLADATSGKGAAPSVALNERDLAYILYTSGSTGKPKGVMLTHGNLMAFMDWCERKFDKLGPTDRIVNTAPFTFDIAGLDVYNAVGFGAALYVVPDQRMINTVLAAIDKEKITFMSTVPTILGAIAQRDAVFKRYNLTSLKTICSGAALCQPTTMRKLHEHLPNAEQWNLYGPTEATIYCLYHKIDPAELSDDTRPVPIGIPYENTEAYVLGPDGKECATGESGELVLRGPHIAAGYFRNPEKTEAAFKNFPLLPHLNEKVYFTGDVVKRDERGLFHFQGRKDDLVKSRGYRIELAEIDLALASIGNALVESIALAVPDPLIENKLYAAVVLNDGAALSDAEIKAHCKSRIPEYMVPDEILFLDSLPKTSSGKISRPLLIEMIKKRS